MVKALIFDLDGTIVNSEEAHLNAFLKSVKKYNIDATEEDISWCRGMAAIDIYKYAINKYPQITETPEELVKRKIDIFINEELQNVTLADGFDDLMDFAKDKYSLALVTSSDEKQKKAIFDKFKLNGLFSVIMTSDDGRKSKPNSEPFRKAIKKLSLEPYNCVVLEDSANGITAANLAGAKTIGVALHAKLTQLKNANIVVKSLKDVIPILEEKKI